MPDLCEECDYLGVGLGLEVAVVVVGGDGRQLAVQRRLRPRRGCVKDSGGKCYTGACYIK